MICLFQNVVILAMYTVVIKPHLFALSQLIKVSRKSEPQIITHILYIDSPKHVFYYFALV